MQSIIQSGVDLIFTVKSMENIKRGINILYLTALLRHTHGGEREVRVWKERVGKKKNEKEIRESTQSEIAEEAL